MKAIVYVDGFNLYYCALKDTPFRWLNLDSLCRRLLPKDEIVMIRYFTALVKPRQQNRDQQNRQRLYLRALQTLPNVKIHLGRFLSHPVRRPLADGSGSAQIIETREKGSDVNLAVNMVHDGHMNLCEASVMISGDSDLLEAVRIVRRNLGKTVGIIAPNSAISHAFKAEASFVKIIRKSALRDSQFPDIMRDSKGAFHKPPTW
ncbi:MAG: NYN domain-containing protein [bacterium]|nr:NYN domain-containing protein [bacterium]